MNNKINYRNLKILNNSLILALKKIVNFHILYLTKIKKNYWTLKKSKKNQSFFIKTSLENTIKII